MSMNKSKLFVFVILMLLFIGCRSQDQPKQNIRKAAVAGQFYHKNPAELKNQLKEFFSEAETKRPGTTRAVIVPHAGYVFSGQVAASAFNQINPNRKIKNVFLLGSAHRVWVNKASVFGGEAYETPLGQVRVNTEIVHKLLENSAFSYNQKAHKNEHSLEVELPFLQHHLKNDFKIIPILVNTQDQREIQSIAKALKPYYTQNNLFVISTDFSHYPSDKNACKTDSLTAEALASGNPEKLLMQIEKNNRKGVSNLKTSMCGLSAMLVFLDIIEDQGHAIEKIEYRNSSDSQYGDRNRVVGYWAMRVAPKQTTKAKEASFSLKATEKNYLLKLARNTIDQYLKTKRIPAIPENDLTPNLKTKTGCFVTLHKNGRLRGCIGNFSGTLPLAEGVQEMAVAAATEDPRFNKLRPEELKSIKIEISVLTPLKPIDNLKDFELGKHGIYIQKGMHSGTYLPQVADGKNWTKEEFVSHCSKHKAGLGKDGWKKAKLYTYEALIFSEKSHSNE